MLKIETTSVFKRSESVLSVTFLVLPGSSVMSIACAIDPLRAANRVIGRLVFDWRIVSLDGAPVQTTAGMALPVSGAFSADAAVDLFVVIAGFGAHSMQDRRLLAGIYRAVSLARAAGGIESGAWLLARAGVLDGHSATTHWEDLQEFELAFPGIDVKPDRYIIDRNRFTTGGASPTFDMMVDLVRRRLGPVAAIDVSSIFIHDAAHDAGDAQPFVSLGRAGSHDPRLIRAIRMMEECLDQPVSVAAIARKLAVSVRTLEKIFMREVAETPGSYFLSLRLNAARRMVKDTRLPLADIAERTGFSSAATFARAFRQRYKTAPSGLRRVG